MTFSKRMGYTPSKVIQKESIDSDLLYSLWNVVKIGIFDTLTEVVDWNDADYDIENLCHELWFHFYKLPVDAIPSGRSQQLELIRGTFLRAEWYRVYDLIEFLANVEIPTSKYQQHPKRIASSVFVKVLNNVLEREFSAYRLIDGVIAPISNNEEIGAIEEAMTNANSFSMLKGSNVHLSTALTLISKKPDPDYRNSIKESISAVEATCRILTGENTLGKALNSLEKKGIVVHDALKAGFERLYVYTNDKQSGIRHAIIEQHENPDFNDAKYMLVVCSSFINFLIGKAVSLGIKIS